MSQKTFRLVVDRDESPLNPREDDNLSTMVCSHRRYDLGDRHDYSPNAYDSWEELKEAIIQHEDPAVILPLYLYDHSGITISTSPFGCRWDSGQVGWVYIPKERARKEYDTQRITQSIIDKCARVIKAEVEDYDAYLTGEVYEYTVYEDSVCDHGHTHSVIVESCGGYFSEDQAEEDGKRVLNHLQPQKAEA